MTNLSTATLALLAALRTNAEGQIEDGWQDVYLDNAFADAPMPKRQRGGCLSALEEAGLYKLVDGFAWGRVNVTEDK